MRLLIAASFLILLAACKTPQAGPTAQAGTTVTESTGYQTPPSGLEGPAYDPSTSPQVMTAGTVLPKPPGYNKPAAKGPVAYGATNGDSIVPPTAYQQPGNPPAGDYPAPATYGSAPNSAPMAAKGVDGAAAPATYSNGVAQPPVGQAALLAGQLTGLWVNNADPREVVEFTPDHYSTFYDGELLLQEAMTYHVDCPGDCSGGTPLGISCFTISGPAGTDCYGILRLTPEVLELSMLGVSTESIIYRKKI